VGRWWVGGCVCACVRVCWCLGVDLHVHIYTCTHLSVRGCVCVDVRVCECVSASIPQELRTAPPHQLLCVAVRYSVLHCVAVCCSRAHGAEPRWQFAILVSKKNNCDALSKRLTK